MSASNSRRHKHFLIDGACILKCLSLSIDKLLTSDVGREFRLSMQVRRIGRLQLQVIQTKVMEHVEAETREITAGNEQSSGRVHYFVGYDVI